MRILWQRGRVRPIMGVAVRELLMCFDDPGTERMRERYRRQHVLDAVQGGTTDSGEGA